ncbi:sialic acid binding Ig-like lectin 8 [Mytilus galloprovincialis]|uniref:Sialic acid binding Ig-like lectin 8 n=1 Tax=Mytilus galloprovincialis TaxID=29158 RepID=A0A8B6GRJ9_MYTGA|nr:sialic acid binding Ig-like lectin 8 [Mytilus galloprovincialis]
MLHGDKRQHPFRKYTLGIKNTNNNSIGNLNQEFRSKFPDNSLISNAPRLTMSCTPNKVYEGHSASLCCSSYSRLVTIDLWFEHMILSSKKHARVLCHKIVNASRYNSGVYRCYVKDNIGIVNAELNLRVLYPPNIPDQHIGFTTTDVSRNLSCLANGVPANYTYGEWKHLSFFGEHIRYLNSAANGRLTLPQISKRINRYQDSGIYICNASNGVVDSTGKRFQNGKIFVIANGPPIFVEKTKYHQYNQTGQKLYLEFIVYTKSMIKSYNVKSDKKEIPALMQMTSVNSTTIFHGTEITVEAFGVVLSFNNNSNSHVYTVTLCNVYGNTSFEVEIELVTTVFLKRKRNTRRNARRATEGMTELAEGYPIPINHAPDKAMRNVKRACVHPGSPYRSNIITGTTSIIPGIVNKPLHLQCPFAYTRTVLKRDGLIVKESRRGSLVYSLIPRKEDHGSTFSCDMYNLAVRIRRKTSVMLDISYKPYLSMNFTPNSVIEGQSVTLCCSSESRPPTLELWWNMGRRLLSSKYDTNVLCHKIIKMSREDSGSYSCFAANEIGTIHDEVIITVLYPPNIPDQRIHFTETDLSRTLQCLAYGVPATYAYGLWHHLSFFGEHIRYLNPSTDGKVTLPPIANKVERYQDNGIYSCTASNRVVDSFGNSFQTGKIFVMSNGPPIFMTKIEHEQYSQPGKTFSLKFIVYSTSEIESNNVKSGNKDITASIQITYINSTMVFHGTEISVETMEIVLSFNIPDKSSRQDYTVTLCNGYSNSSFVVNITSSTIDIEEKKTDETKVAVLILSILMVMCVPIIGAAGQPVPVENIVYQTATQSVAVRPTPDQTSVDVIDYNRSSYIREQNSGPLTGQLYYADVIFPPSTTQDVVHIIGIENRTVYADVTVSGGATNLVDSRNETSSDEEEEDFVEIQGLKNFVDKRKEH